MLARLLRIGAWQLLTLLALVSAAASFACAQTFKVLYSFTGGADGGGVYGGVVMDKAGNLYGTTSGGGAYGYGTVFELSPNADGTWTETVLHSFMNGDPDGQEPESTLEFDGAGNLYGTAAGGKYLHGTLFELSPSSGGWSTAPIYSFGAYVGDAAIAGTSILMDPKGNIWGTALGGAIGSGAVYELSPGSGGWTEKVLYSFGANNGADGYDPSGLVFDAAGNLYGPTAHGGDLACDPNSGCGVVYELKSSSSGWKESALHRFGSASKDGAFPTAGLAVDSLGSLYGITPQGGANTCGGAGCGTVFKLTSVSRTSWKESIVHQFAVAGGNNPSGRLILDGSGSLYGSTSYGGQACSCGVIYELTPGGGGRWTYKVLHAFDGSDGNGPQAGLLLDGSGNLYGTTVVGGPGGVGVVFEITP